MRTPGDQPPAGGEGGGTGPAGGDPAPPGVPPGPESGPAEVGRVLAGRYRVTGRLGRGGMGVVWRAVDEVLGREVAVKELRTFSDAAAGELDEMRTRMQREARAAARVRHEGVVSVHDVAQHDGRPVIVMELIEGPSLDDVLRERGTVDPREAAAIGAKVMGALAAAHRAGVLHRDVKPGNVLLDSASDRVVLTDFGIAAVEDPDDGASTQLTGSGELVGSLDYLAPERARGEPPREACDVWALGATLYAAVEGAAPFRRTSTWSTLNAIVVEPLPEPLRAGPLAPVLAELLEKDPQKRAGAERATALLDAVAKGTQPPADPSSTMQLGRAERGAAGSGAESGTDSGAAQGAVGQGQFGPPQPASGAAFAAGGHGGSGHDPRFPASPAPDAGAGRSGATDRHTVRTRAERASSLRRALIAAGVALVVLTGAGVAYAAMSGGDDEDPARAGATSGKGAAPGAGKRGGSVPEKDGPSPDGRQKTSAGRDSAGGGGDKGGGSGSGGRSGGAAGGASGTVTGGGSTGGGGAPKPKPACHPKGGGKFDCTVWKTAASYNARHEPVGRLEAGVNYFFCQKKLPRHRETSGRWTNVWWAKTDDDNGHKGVFVSDVYIRGGKNNEPVPGLPVC